MASTSSSPAYSPAQWEEGWRAGNPKFDRSSAHPALIDLLDVDSKLGHELGIPDKGTALVPGCGRGYDVHLLARRGLHTSGLELAPTGVAKANEWLEAHPLPSSAAKGSAQVIKQDFFSYTPDGMETYDVILDYQFLPFMPSNLREDWADALFYLSHPNSSTTSRPATILIVHISPAHNIPDGEIDQLLNTHWDSVRVVDVRREQTHNLKTEGEKLFVWRRR